MKLPSEPINFFLFGDPSGSGSPGWYAAYIEKKKTEEMVESQSHQLLGTGSGSSNEDKEKNPL